MSWFYQHQRNKKLYWRYKMSKLRLALIFVVAVMLVLTAVSCSKKSTEPEDGIPNFQNMDQFWNYVEGFEWAIVLGYEIVENDMMVWMAPVEMPEISEEDTFSLVVNNQAIPVEVYVDYDGDAYVVINHYHDIVLPNSTNLAVKFTHNNVEVINTSIRMPSFPSLQNLPEAIDWTKPLTLKWSLNPNRNSSFQNVWAYVESDYDDDYDYDEYEKIVNGAARQHTIPAGTFSISNVLNYEVGVGEVNLKKDGNSLLISTCGDIVSNDYGYSRTNVRKVERLLKTRK